jgi:hypothetical protein
MSDQYGKFCNWFCMPLCKVEELTMLLITWGCIREPRTHWRANEFRDCMELLVLSLLNILGQGASFHSLGPLRHISLRECCTFSKCSLMY